MSRLFLLKELNFPPTINNDNDYDNDKTIIINNDNDNDMIRTITMKTITRYMTSYLGPTSICTTSILQVPAEFNRVQSPIQCRTRIVRSA